MATWQHLRSSTANKRPTTSLADGRIAINTNTASPGLFFKDSAGTGIVKVGPVHVGTTAPNSVPASGGSSGNYTGEQWLDTSVSPAQMKVWNGSTWVGIVADELPVSKLQDGAPRQLIQTDAAGTGVEWTSNVDVPGTLDVTGASTLDSTLSVAGVATFATGSAGSPSLTFTGDANSGVYSPGADQVAISTNGTGRLFVDASGNVSLGQASSALQSGGTGLTIYGASASEIKLLNSTTGSANTDGTALVVINSDFTINNREAGGIFFGTSNAERMRLDSSGRLGLGTSSVRGTSLLDARGDISFGSNANYYGLLSYNAATGHIESTSSDGGFKWIRASGPATSMTLDSSGRLGIGTTTPGYLLTASTSSTSTTLNDSAHWTVAVQNAAAATANQFNSLLFRFNDGIYNGNSIISALRESGTGRQQSLIFAPANSSGDPTERARIDSSGRLLVGTSSQSGGSLLQVNDNRIRIATAKTPASATDTGVAGEICWDANYVYVCTATNTWKRSAISTW